VSLELTLSEENIIGVYSFIPQEVRVAYETVINTLGNSDNPIGGAYTFLRRLKADGTEAFTLDKIAVQQKRVFGRAQSSTNCEEEDMVYSFGLLILTIPIPL